MESEKENICGVSNVGRYYTVTFFDPVFRDTSDNRCRDALSGQYKRLAIFLRGKHTSYQLKATKISKRHTMASIMVKGQKVVESLSHRMLMAFSL